MSYLKPSLTPDYLEGIKQNNGKLIKCIYKNFLPRIAIFIQNNGGNFEDAEDVFSDALEAILRKVTTDELTLTCSFYTYLFEVCKRLWSKMQRRKKSYAKYLLDTETVDKQWTLNDHSLQVTQEKYLLYKEKFSQLSQNSQHLLFLVVAEKCSMTEIALLMGYKSAGYARKRKHQCVQQLAALIQHDVRYGELING